MAGLVGEFILDKLSETMDSADDFRVFACDLLVRYPAEREAGDSVVRLRMAGQRGKEHER